MSTEAQGAKPRHLHRLAHPFKRRGEGVQAKPTREAAPTGTTHQNTLYGIEGRPSIRSAEGEIKSEHESYIEFLTKASTPIPDLSSISGLPYEDQNPTVRTYVNQTYKEYLIEKDKNTYERKPIEPSARPIRRIIEIRSGKEFILDEPEPVSYREYMLHSGRKYIPIYYGEVLNTSEKEYITQTYKEYLIWEIDHFDKPEARDYLKGVNRLNSSIEQHLKGDTAPPIIAEGKIMSGIEYWDYVLEKREREKQEAIDRGEFPDIYHSMPLVQENLHFDETKPLTPDQGRERNRSIVMALRGQFVTEVKKADIDLIAENIRSDIWNGSSTLTELRPAVAGKITIKQDGTIINRLRSGLALSYPSLDEHGKLTTKPDRKQTLSMGIGYFGEEDEANIITEAQGTIPPEDLKKGIKAYFVERTFVDVVTQKKKTYRTIIPFAYANSRLTFYEHLADSAIYLDPRKFVPRRQVRRYHKPTQAAA